MPRILVLFATILLVPALAQARTPCGAGRVVLDADGDGVAGRSETGIAGVRVSDGIAIVATDARGEFRLPAVAGRTWFVIKPAGYSFPRRSDGLPAFWRHVPDPAAPALRFGGIVEAQPGCPTFLLRKVPPRADGLDVLVLSDPQTRTKAQVGYYARDIVEPLRAGATDADLGLVLGDVADDDLSLYPDLKAVTTRVAIPWLHAAGNHDLDFDAADDAGSLRTFRQHFGPDTFAWEEPEATFLVLDDVVYRPGQRPAYVGGLRDDQFAFLERYLPTVDPMRLLVVALHIPLFDPPGRETFRAADRVRLFGLLQRFPRLLVLSGHGHVQRHVFHDAKAGWAGAEPLHEYNVGAASGAFWSGVADAEGIPDATMADGTPNGHARLHVERDGRYRLGWHPARLAAAPHVTDAMALHAPQALRRGAYPAWAVYANVFMGTADTRVEYRIDQGEWKPMARVERADPRVLAENARDDEAPRLRGYDRSPEAEPSTHLWRGALATDLAVGEHEVEVRAFDPWHGEQRASTRYELQEPPAPPR